MDPARLNRLRSIQADAAFVSEISDLFPQFPVIGMLTAALEKNGRKVVGTVSVEVTSSLISIIHLANERCGTWYVHPSKVQATFFYLTYLYIY
jgi:hypothetical protein